MSHITRLKISIVNKFKLMSIVQDMGYTCIDSTRVITAHDDAEVRADMYLKEHPSVGFSKRDGAHEIVGEFWRTGLNESRFKKEIESRYSLSSIMDEASQYGYVMGGDIVVKRDGSLEVELLQA